MTTAAHLLFFSGSTRTGSVNVKLARLAMKIAEANGIKSTYLDLSDYPMPIYDGDLEANDGVPDNAFKLKHLLDAHQGVFIAAPEYNAGITPLLKNTIDWISRVKENDQPPGTVFKTRTFGLASAAASEGGGIRGLIQLRQTLAVGLGANVIGSQIVVPSAHTAFDDSGNIKDETRFSFLKGYVENLARIATLQSAGAS